MHCRHMYVIVDSAAQAFSFSAGLEFGVASVASWRAVGVFVAWAESMENNGDLRTYGEIGKRSSGVGGMTPCNRPSEAA